MQPIHVYKYVQSDSRNGILFCHTDPGERNDSQSTVVLVKSKNTDRVHQIAAIIAYRTFLQEYYSMQVIRTGKSRIDAALRAINTALHRFYTINKIKEPADIHLCAITHDRNRVATFSNNGFMVGTLRHQIFQRVPTTPHTVMPRFGESRDEIFESAVTPLRNGDLIFVASHKQLEDILREKIQQDTGKDPIGAIFNGLDPKIDELNADQNLALVALKVTETVTKVAPPFVTASIPVQKHSPFKKHKPAKRRTLQLPKFSLPRIPLPERPQWTIPEAFRPQIQQWGIIGMSAMIILLVAVMAIRTAAERTTGDPTQIAGLSTSPPASFLDTPVSRSDPPPAQHSEPAVTVPAYNPGEEIWVYGAPKSVSSSPIVRHGNVYVGCKDNYLYALDYHTGEIKWRVKTGGGIGSSPAVSGDRVYVGSYDGYLYCVQAVRGDVLWKFRTQEKIVSSPVVHQGLVYIGSFDNTLYAIRERDGQQQWKFSTKGDIWATPVVDAEKVYLASFDGFVYALNREDGQLEWKYQVGDEIYSSPEIVGQLLFLGSRNHYLYALSTIDGKEMWKFKTKGKIYASPKVWNGMVYVGSNAGIFYAVEAVSGAEQWQFSLGREVPIRSRATIEGGVVYFTAYDHYLYAVDAYSGNLLWKYQADSEIYSSPAIAGNRLYFGSLNGTLYALNAATP
ncbi:MAG: hypothetical protein D6675_06770 [Gemmatimonadetes bacterium]|nr:MAG: hypothetical protein D6675_06770 [Gemmatimonadota bacterium]